MGRHRQKLALTASALGLALSVVSPASASTIGGFGVRPGTFNPNNPVTRAYFIPTIAAGKSYTGTVVVTNTRNAPVHLYVYSVDGVTGVTSGAVYGNRSDRLRRAGRWLLPTVHSITLAPTSQRRVRFSVMVPAGARPGDYLAGIAFEDANPRKSGGRFSVIEVLRTVIGVDVRVPGPAFRHVALTSLSLAPLPGTKTTSVVVGVRNNGQLNCKPLLAVSVATDGRWRTVDHRLDTVLPGDTIPYPLSWPQSLNAGDYPVAATATGCGPRTSLARDVHLGMALTAAGRTPAPRGTVKTVVPWWLIAIAGVLAIALIAVVVLLARGRRGLPQPPVPATGSSESGVS